MNKLLMVIIFMSVSGLSHALTGSPNNSGYDHGNGGDYIRELFHKSRQSTSEKIKELLPCSFDGLDPEASAWVLKNSNQLIEDIMYSPHYWTVDSQPTCGFTDRKYKQGIYFSYPTCLNTTNSEEKIIFILIHESVHHFGFSDEQFADRVARTVSLAKKRISCPEPDSPFDVNFCEGENIMKKEALNYFTSGNSISNFIGSSYIRRRISKCNQLGGCGEPSETNVSYTLRQPDGIPDTPITINSTFEVNSDFRLSISFNQINLNFPRSLYLLNPVCIGDVSVKSECYLNDANGNYNFKGKVTNHCFKMLESHHTEPSHSDGSYFNIETVWYSNF